MAELNLCCPRCRGGLEHWSARYECRACGATYPIYAGIPDFRLYPDPYIDLAADRAKGLRLAEAAKQLSFADLVTYYYAITPEVTPAQARRFRDHHLAGRARGLGVLARLPHYGLAPATQRWLDLGCGTGGLLAAAAGQATCLVGVDIAFRWLVVAQRRLAEAGQQAQLICACADHLPFADAQFDLVIAEGLLEHTPAIDQVLSEAGRVRSPSGAFLARSVNRLALAPEPHVGLWGVGWLPRPLMEPYVRWRRGLPYQHIYLRGLLAMSRSVRRSGQPDLRLRMPWLGAADYQHHPPVRRQLFRAYRALATSLPPLRPLLSLIGPYIDLTASGARPAVEPQPRLAGR